MARSAPTDMQKRNGSSGAGIDFLSNRNNNHTTRTVLAVVTRQNAHIVVVAGEDGVVKLYNTRLKFPSSASGFANAGKYQFADSLWRS